MPESIWQLTALTELRLNENHLVSVPELMGQLTSLTYLGLDQNQLVSVPESIGQLTGLEELRIDDNVAEDRGSRPAPAALESGGTAVHAHLPMRGQVRLRREAVWQRHLAASAPTSVPLKSCW